MQDLFEVDEEDYSKVHTDKIIDIMCVPNTQDMNSVQRRPSNSDKVKFIPTHHPIVIAFAIRFLKKMISTSNDHQILYLVSPTLNET